MNSKIILRAAIYGLLTWLIPFVISFFFYDKSEELIVSYDVFKSVMVVVSTITGGFLLILYLKHFTNKYLLNALVIGITWLLLNILLDVIIVMPMLKISFSKYFMSIGLVYINIPVLAINIAVAMYVKGKKAES